MIERLRETFCEEARDHLQTIEVALLELNDRPGDAELIDRTFRSLHTLKGSGAMCGFEALARFAHHLENSFSELRDGRRAVTPELVRVALAARDHIEALLESGAAPDPALVRQGEEILRRLGVDDGATGPGADRPPAARDAEGDAPGRLWHIYFRPASDILWKGTNPLLLLRELSELGETRVEAHQDALPALEAMDPSQCYLSWDIWLRTPQPQSAIRDVFIFVEDDVELLIEPVEEPHGASPDAASGEALAEESEAVKAAESVRNARMAASSSLRVPTEKLDRLVNIVGELVTVQARLSRLAASDSDTDLQFVAEEMERLTAELRENSMSLRMVPLRGTFERFRRLVHDLAVELGKQVRLETEGGDTELDKTLIDQLNDPLVHLIRNSMDHGVEMPEYRAAAGKNPVATIRLSARYAGASVLITVSDDGAGLNRQQIRQRAIEKGLIPADRAVEDRELLALIFKPGFSTARQVTDLSGRGVGLDVVRRCMEELHGSVEIASQEAQGTTFTLRLPLTLAIVDGLLVRIGTEHFVLPMANLVECVERKQEETEARSGAQLVEVRGELVPFLRLRDYLHIPGLRPAHEQIMVAELPSGCFGFAVDEVLGNHQTVIKPLGRLCRHAQLFAGATILGDGTVALILDLQRLVESAIRESAWQRPGGRTASPGARWQPEAELVLS